MLDRMKDGTGYASEVTPEIHRNRAAGEALQKKPQALDIAQLQRRLETAGCNFSDSLLALIDRTGKKDSEIYRKANIHRKLFSKIRSNPHYRPSKATALAFAIALELDLEQTKALIGKAGYALSDSSRFDIIVEFFIANGHYDIYEINRTLYEFDQMLLGSEQ